MLDLVDRFLLNSSKPSDDQSLTFRRINGRPSSSVIYFLPWCTSFRLAYHVGLIPLDYLACYEMPPAIVSSQPDLCVQAMLSLIADAEQLLMAHEVRGADAVIVGLSVGTFPATYLANRIGARLCSVASVDRADLAVWLSPATRIVKERAVQKGLALSDYSRALEGYHPGQNLARLAPNSVFVVGQRDPYVPPCRKDGLLQAIQDHARSAQVIELNKGHFATLTVSAGYQRAMVAAPTATPTTERGRASVEQPASIGKARACGATNHSWEPHVHHVASGPMDQEAPNPGHPTTTCAPVPNESLNVAELSGLGREDGP